MAKAVYQGNGIYEVQQSRGVAPRIFTGCVNPNDKVGDFVDVDMSDIVSNELTGAFSTRQPILNPVSK